MAIAQRQKLELESERNSSAQLAKQQQQIKGQMATREEQLMRLEEQVGSCDEHK
jgi:hypothetical protein